MVIMQIYEKQARFHKLYSNVYDIIPISDLHDKIHMHACSHIKNINVCIFTYVCLFVHVGR